MRWLHGSVLGIGLSLAPGVAAEGTAKSWSHPAPSSRDLFATARERAREIALQGAAGSASAPAQTSPRFLSLDAAKGSRAGVVYAWPVPDSQSRPHRALVLLGKILAGDLTASLNEELISRRRLAASATAKLWGLRGKDLFLVQISGALPEQMDEVEAAVDVTLGRLSSVGPEPGELELARGWLLSELRERAGGELEMSTVPDVYAAVSAEDVRNAAQEFLTVSRRTTVEIRPRGAPEPWLGAPAKDRPFRLHTVKQGDTLKALAKRHGVEVETIAKANRLGKKTSPYVGQTLKIPRAALRKVPARKNK